MGNFCECESAPGISKVRLSFQLANRFRAISGYFSANYRKTYATNREEFSRKNQLFTAQQNRTHNTSLFITLGT